MKIKDLKKLEKKLLKNNAISDNQKLKIYINANIDYMNTTNFLNDVNFKTYELRYEDFMLNNQKCHDKYCSIFNQEFAGEVFLRMTEIYNFYRKLQNISLTNFNQRQQEIIKDIMYFEKATDIINGNMQYYYTNPFVHKLYNAIGDVFIRHVTNGVLTLQVFSADEKQNEQ